MSENNRDFLDDIIQQCQEVLDHPSVQHKSDSQTEEGAERSLEAFGGAEPTIGSLIQLIRLILPALLALQQELKQAGVPSSNIPIILAIAAFLLGVWFGYSI